MGSASLGWAAIRLENREPAAVLDIGVRIFPAGVNGLETGRDVSHFAKRREARLARRQNDRRRRRIAKIYKLLTSFGLVPPARTPEQRTAVLSELDKELAGRLNCHDKLPYLLRAQGLDRKLEVFELGRALFHLAQRRGFLSNRKSGTEEEQGTVKAEITELGKLIADSGARTVGEYLAGLDPHSARIRDWYTSRKMYIDEFECLWAAQTPHYPGVLTEERKRALCHAMFFQRPLRDQSALIGKCELEHGEQRAPIWHPLFQHYRLLQEVNHLRVGSEERPLAPEERHALVERLRQGDLPVKELRQMLGLSRVAPLNLERGGKKSLVGDRTQAKLRAVFLNRWDALTPAEQLEAIADAAGDLDDASLEAKGRERWGLSGEQAQAYAHLRLENGYASFSLKALERLIPHLERGEDAMTARLAEYGEERTEVLDQLPKVSDCLPEIRNFAVTRALTELRKVVNALIRRYGKPREIHIELARELKASKDERYNRSARMRRLEAERKAIAEDLLKKGLVSHPGREDIEKWRLAEECKWRCPYTGKCFSANQLLALRRNSMRPTSDGL